jgi:hypothetical protein
MTNVSLRRLTAVAALLHFLIARLCCNDIAILLAEGNMLLYLYGSCHTTHWLHHSSILDRRELSQCRREVEKTWKWETVPNWITGTRQE